MTQHLGWAGQTPRQFAGQRIWTQLPLLRLNPSFPPLPPPFLPSCLSERFAEHQHRPSFGLHNPLITSPRNQWKCKKCPDRDAWQETNGRYVQELKRSGSIENVDLGPSFQKGCLKPWEWMTGSLPVERGRHLTQPALKIKGSGASTRNDYEIRGAAQVSQNQRTLFLS